MSTNAQPVNKEKSLPIINGIPRSPQSLASQPRREISLWANPTKNITQEQYEKLSEQGKNTFNKQRDLMGVITVTDVERKRDVRIFVSGWISEEPGQSPRIKLMGDLNSGQGLLGSMRAMVKYQGEEADPSHGLRMLGDLKFKRVDNSEFTATISGQINPKFLSVNKDALLDAAVVFGFPEGMTQKYIDGLYVKESQKLMQSAQKAKELASEQMTPQKRPAPV